MFCTLFQGLASSWSSLVCLLSLLALSNHLQKFKNQRKVTRLGPTQLAELSSFQCIQMFKKNHTEWRFVAFCRLQTPFFELATFGLGNVLQLFSLENLQKCLHEQPQIMLAVFTMQQLLLGMSKFSVCWAKTLLQMNLWMKKVRACHWGWAQRDGWMDSQMDAPYTMK